MLILIGKIENNDMEWEKEWDEFLNRLYVTDVYGFYRNKLKSFDNHWEIIYQKHKPTAD